MQMRDIKLGDAHMTYVQSVIQGGNLTLFQQILASKDGRDDFIESRDRY